MLHSSDNHGIFVISHLRKGKDFKFWGRLTRSHEQQPWKCPGWTLTPDVSVNQLSYRPIRSQKASIRGEKETSAGRGANKIRPRIHKSTKVIPIPISLEKVEELHSWLLCIRPTARRVLKGNVKPSESSREKNEKRAHAEPKRLLKNSDFLGEIALFKLSFQSELGQDDIFRPQREFYSWERQANARPHIAGIWEDWPAR